MSYEFNIRHVSSISYILHLNRMKRVTTTQIRINIIIMIIKAKTLGSWRVYD